jgi:transglutaminase-like putative cysteine protease
VSGGCGLAHDGRLLWVADRKRSLLFGVDLASGLVTREVPAPENPQGLAYDGTYLWVADGKRLHQVTTEDGTTIKSVNAPAWSGEGRGTEQLGLAWDDGYLWVSDRHRDRLYRVDPEDGEVVDLLPTPGPFPAGLAVVTGKLLMIDVDRHRVDSLTHRALPRVVRRKPRRETIVLRRTVTNRGPGQLTEAHVFVAVPRSLPNQALRGDPEFTPRPREFVEDRWGQRFAHFEAKKLGPGESLEVVMTVRATVFEAQYHVDPVRVGSLRSIPKDVREEYLADASKFAIRHPSIKKHVKKALKGEKRPYWMVRRIARYIQRKMHYELAGGWNIAPTVIDRGSGSCSEYTFVFISMCRAAGIPARYVGALVVRGDDAATDDVFHRWAEVYLPGYGWVPHDVQHGDKPEPEQRGDAFGTLVNRFLITTIGGGASEHIGWDYNSTANWVCDGRCEVDDLHVGDWYPSERGPEKP